MDLTWYQSLIYGFFSGFFQILPVSAQAHKAVLLTLFGHGSEPVLLRLLTDISVFAAVYYCCQNQITRMIRQHKLTKIPKKRRRRPVDVRCILDMRLLKMMCIPVILSFFLYTKTAFLSLKLSWIAAFVLINAIILYLPVLLPTGNKDSRSLSRLEGLLIGLGGGASILPGFSSIGISNAIGSLCGADRNYILNLSIILQLPVMLGFIVFDLITIVSVGIGAISFGLIVFYILAAALAFAGVIFAVRIMRGLAAHIGFHLFSYYALALALFSFILYLMV